MTSLFRTRQPFLQTNAWQNQAINALHYNTSQQGSVVPLIYGTVRQPINLLDFQNYRGPVGSKGKTGSLPVTGTQSRSAKGGSSKSGKKSSPNYSIDAMFAVGMGPMVGIGQVYSSAGIASFGSLPLNFYSGADGQAADTTFAGFGSIVGYSGTATVSGTPIDLGPSPVLPNIAVEAIGLEVGINTGSLTSDANPANAITDFLTNPRYGAGFPSANLDDLTTLTGMSFAEYCQAAPLLISVSLDGHQKAIEWLDSISKLCNSAMVFSGKLLQFIPFGDLTLNNNGAMWTPNLTPVYDLTDHHFLPWRQHELGREPSPGEDDPILVTRTNAADAYNWRSIEYTDRSNFYNSTTLTVNDQGLTDTYGLRIGDSIQGRAFCNVTSAQVSAQLTIQRDEYIRNTPYKIQIGWQYARLIPMDIITLTGRYADMYLDLQPVRILSIEEDDQGGLTVEAEEIQTGVSAPIPVPVPIELDGIASAQGLGPFALTTSGLTTTKTDDIIVIHVTMLQDNLIPHTSLDDIPRVDSIVSSSGLVINVRGGPYTFNDSLLGSNGPSPPCGLGAPCAGSVEVYWAHSTGILSGETFTVTFNPSGIAAGLVSVSAFANVNVSSPFDANPGLPAVHANMTNTDVGWPFVDNVSTNGNNTALVGSLSSWSPLGGGVENIELSGGIITNTQAIQVFVGIFTTMGTSWQLQPTRLSLSTVNFNCSGGRCSSSEPNWWFGVVDALKPRFP